MFYNAKFSRDGGLFSAMWLFVCVTSSLLTSGSLRAEVVTLDLLPVANHLEFVTPSQPAGAITFNIDPTITRIIVHVNSTSNAVGTTIQTPVGSIINPANVGTVGGSHQAFTVPDAPSGLGFSPLLSPSSHQFYDIPNLGSGLYTVNFTGGAGITEPTPVAIDVLFEGGVRVTLLATNSPIPTGTLAVLAAPVIAGNQGVIGATVSVQIVRPSGSFFYITLRDDGGPFDGQAGDGLYSGPFIATEAGQYTCVAEITGNTSAGIPFRRTAATSVEAVSTCARFTLNRTEYGVDDNQDGLYEAMMIQQEVEVLRPAELLLEVELLTPAGIKLRAVGRQTLPVGIQNIDAKLSSESIWSTAEDGPYTVLGMTLTCIEPGITPLPGDVKAYPVTAAAPLIRQRYGGSSFSQGRADDGFRDVFEGALS